MHGAAGAEPPPSAEIQVLCSSTGQTKSGRGHRRWLRPCPPPLCSVCCWGQRDRAGGRARRSAGMTPTSCLCGWLASSKANSSLRGVLCYPNPHNGFLFFFQVVKSQTFLKQGRGALVTAAWARLAPAYRPAPPARQGWLPETSEIGPFVKLTCGPNDNFPAWVCRMI